MQKYLMNTPRAVEFLTLTQTEAGRRAKLGDDKKFEFVGQTIRDAHDTLQKGVERVVALVRDETRTPAAKHDAARRLAEDTAKQLAFARNQLAAKAESLLKDGAALADARFGMSGDRSAIDAKLIEWVQGQASKDGGVGQVRKAAMEDPQLAAVIYNAPSYLLGINDASHGKMRFALVEKHAPNAYKAMDQGEELMGLLSRYDKTIESVQTSFFSTEQAAKASTHVEVA